MTRRYYMESLPIDGGVLNLPAEEAEHAIRVMRARVGDAITIFDGKGTQAAATIQSIGRRDCVCEAEPAERVVRVPNVRLDMAIALPKPDRAKELVERLTEMGVANVIPIIADRTQRPPSDSTIKKLHRVVIEACKQSGRNTLMTIDAPMKSDDYFASVATTGEASNSESSTRLIAHPCPGAESAASQRGAKSYDVAIGPEGGWTQREIDLASGSGFQSVKLGSLILRIETAAVMIAAGLIIDCDSR